MEYSVSTSVGKFRIKKIGSMISVGGNNLCVSVVYKGNNGDDSELLSLNKEKGGCELTGKTIAGKDTVLMTHLAINLLHADYPSLRKIHLLDSSTFKCRLPDGSVKQLSLTKTLFLFTGKTYYESRFSAVPRYDTSDTMEAYRAGRLNPLKKPKYFSFNNPELQSILEPLYNETSTWDEFFRRIDEIYGTHKCAIIYPWYLHALALLHTVEMPTHWTIDMLSVPEIAFVMTGGGIRKKTHKRMRFSYAEFFFDREGIYDIPYNNFIKQIIMRSTKS